MQIPSREQMEALVKSADVDGGLTRFVTEALKETRDSEMMKSLAMSLLPRVMESVTAGGLKTAPVLKVFFFGWYLGMLDQQQRAPDIPKDKIDKFLESLEPDNPDVNEE